MWAHAQRAQGLKGAAVKEARGGPGRAGFSCRGRESPSVSSIDHS